jgi:SAM-dependent methyltransferase
MPAEAGDPSTYLFPRHPGEIDRLDVQHYAIRDTLQANYLAPLEVPRRILDVGCGTGQWAFELSRQFPAALVVGMDLVASKPDQPPGYRFVNGDLLRGLPFADAGFDFVHQRLLVSGIPLAAWPGAVAELARVARPGGWVELVEVPWEVEKAGPATERLLELTRGLSASRGLETRRTVFDSLERYLGQAGLLDVRRRQVSVPIGDWGGQAGSLSATDMRTAFTRMCELLQSRKELSAAAGAELIRRSQEESERRRMAWPVAVAWGRRPG